MQNSWNLIEIANQHRLKNNAHVWGEEELDVYCLGPPWVLLVNDFDSGCESLEINQSKEDNDSSKQLT